jgi:hypothetical protein
MNNSCGEKNHKSGQRISAPAVKILLVPGKVLKVLFICIGALVIVNSAGIISRIGFDHDYCFGLVPLFDFDTEMNFPTFYSAITLMFASVLLAVIAYCQKVTNSRFRAWVGLALIFLYLSLDEFCSLHERLEAPFDRLLHTYGFTGMSNIFSYAWVIPVGAAVFFLGIVYLPFLFKLPRKTMIMFLVSGGIFVGGAIGVETLGGIQDRLHGEENLIYMLLAMTEEVMEMTGVALFIYTLLNYIKDYLPGASIAVAESED